MGRKAKDTAMEATLRNLERRGYVRGTKKQMEEWYERLVYMPVDEVRRIADNERSPVVCYVSARALLGKRGFASLMEIVDRLYGKPTERKEISGELSMAALLMESGILDEEDAEEGGDGE